MQVLRCCETSLAFDITISGAPLFRWNKSNHGFKRYLLGDA
jgi:hypothetical protein